jgi:mRNA-degrading endonuclease toxin of MazEF toxin-antitoxin module
LAESKKQRGNVYMNFIDYKRKNFKKGDVFWIFFPQHEGDEYGNYTVKGRRPAVCLHGAEDANGTVMVAPITTFTEGKRPGPCDAVFRADELPPQFDRDEVVKVDQVRTFPVEALEKYKGTLPPQCMREVERGLLQVAEVYDLVLDLIERDVEKFLEAEE